MNGEKVKGEKIKKCKGETPEIKQLVNLKL